MARRFQRVPTRPTVAPDDGAPPPTPPGRFYRRQAERVGNFPAGHRPHRPVRAGGRSAGSATAPGSAYDCGAPASGRHGGPNACLQWLHNWLAALAPGRGHRHIPAVTWFVGAEHNTRDDGTGVVRHRSSGTWAAGRFRPPAWQLPQPVHAAERCRRFASSPGRGDRRPGWRHVRGRRHDLRPAPSWATPPTPPPPSFGRRSMSRGPFSTAGLPHFARSPAGCRRYHR